MPTQANLCVTIVVTHPWLPSSRGSVGISPHSISQASRAAADPTLLEVSDRDSFESKFSLASAAALVKATTCSNALVGATIPD